MLGGGIGIQIGATTSPMELGAVAAEAERLGYSEAWLAEDYFDLGGVASAAVALGATHGIPIGLGVVAARVRHPAALAMEYATLGGAHPDRFMAGIGHGAPGWLRQMGLETDSPMRLLREVTSSVRSLLDGDELTADGEYFRFGGVRLSHVPSARVPLFLGVHGPASLRASGELADGTLLGWFSSPAYVAWARERIDEGRERGGRSDRHELVALVVVSVSEEDPAGAVHDLGRWAGPMLAGMTRSPQVTASSVQDELTEWAEATRNGGAEPIVPSDLLQQFAAVGDLATCRDTIHRLAESGADRVVLVPNPAGLLTTTAMIGQMEAAAPLIQRE